MRTGCFVTFTCCAHLINYLSIYLLTYLLNRVAKCRNCWGVRSIRHSGSSLTANVNAFLIAPDKRRAQTTISHLLICQSTQVTRWLGLDRRRPLRDYDDRQPINQSRRFCHVLPQFSTAILVSFQPVIVPVINSSVTCHWHRFSAILGHCHIACLKFIK